MGDKFEIYHIPEEPAPQPAERPSEKKPRKLFVRIIANLLVIAMVSFGSISGYKLFIGGGLLPSDAPQAGDEDELGPEIIYKPVIYTAAEGSKALSIPEIAKKARPSVVTVLVSSGSSASSGSGVIMSEDGYIITNYHVIQAAGTVKVVFMDGTEYEAKVIGGDQITDLAILKIEASGLPAAEFGDSDKLDVGEQVVAIGNPLGIEFSGTVTVGYVSAIGREVEVEGIKMTLIQTDATINPGNSGGALINCYGQVIGITSAKIDISYAEGLGFAIPITDAIGVIYDLINFGYITDRPYIGITVENVTPYMQMYYRVPAGVYITEVAKDSPADKAGLVAGDIITAVNGKTITSFNELNSLKSEMKIGDVMKLKVYTSSGYKDVELTLSGYSEKQ